MAKKTMKNNTSMKNYSSSKKSVKSKKSGGANSSDKGKIGKPKKLRP